VRRAAAIVGGVGFFIDELGKFITEDNNYFYNPAAALIYLIFIGLFNRVVHAHARDAAAWPARRAGPGCERDRPARRRGA
jgi:hypothetical protein